MKKLTATVFVAGLGVVVSMVGPRLGATEPPSADYYPMATRNLKLVIAYTPEERKNIRQVQLFSSRDQGQTWTLESTATPDRDFFPFAAKDDGVYWFNMVVVYNDGTKDPPDITRSNTAQKLLVDTTPPVVRLASAARTGDEVSVEWGVEEKYPNPTKTKLAYRPVVGTEGEWKDVPLAGSEPRSARFNPNSASAILVRVTAEDLAGNTHSATREIAGTTTAFRPPADQSKPAAAAPAGGPIAPPTLEVVAPASLPAAVPPPAPPAPVVELSGANSPPVGASPVTPAAAPPSTLPPPSFPQPAVTHETTAAAPPMPIAVGSGPLSAPPPAPAPAPQSSAASPVVTVAAEQAPVQIINYTRFDLPYQLESGPSGVRQIDLYVTRDEGRSWTRWSQHDGKEVPLRVNLETRVDARPDGTYGFKLVPTSGAGLSEEPPRPGTPPDLRVQVDTVPPLISIYQPDADPANRDVLVLRWSITDKNLGKDPVALEWSESPTGPWRSVTANDSLVPVAAGQSAAGPHRIPNTGRYAWKIPSTLPTHLVYLKVTAWDTAGNKSEIATDKPILVDLVKPRARIQGIQPAVARP